MKPKLAYKAQKVQRRYKKRGLYIPFHDAALMVKYVKEQRKKHPDTPKEMLMRDARMAILPRIIPPTI